MPFQMPSLGLLLPAENHGQICLYVHGGNWGESRSGNLDDFLLKILKVRIDWQTVSCRTAEA